MTQNTTTQEPSLEVLIANVPSNYLPAAEQWVREYQWRHACMRNHGAKDKNNRDMYAHTTHLNSLIEKFFNEVTESAPHNEQLFHYYDKQWKVYVSKVNRTNRRAALGIDIFKYYVDRTINTRKALDLDKRLTLAYVETWSDEELATFLSDPSILDKYLSVENPTWMQRKWAAIKRFFSSKKSKP